MTSLDGIHPPIARLSRAVARIIPALALALGLAAPARASTDADTLVRTQNPERYQISISATKLPRRTEEVANGVTIVSGDELRRRGTRTLAEALQDVVGLDTGEGSDNGTTVPNLGLWGLKEFDALLVTLDGVPVGGPFNPSLTQIPVQDIDRIEIVKGPQGTLYGVSAFAGTVQVFTRSSESGLLHASAGGGSFSSWHGAASIHKEISEATKLYLSLGTQRSVGWQDRTRSEDDRGRIVLSHSFGKANASADVGTYYVTQEWGSPLPVDAGAPIAGFAVDRNYAVGGARLDHHVVSGNMRIVAPLSDRVRLENTFGAYQDRQASVRSFIEPDPATSAPGVVTPSQGVYLNPIEKAVFEELRLVGQFEAGGRHDLVTGAAVTYGRVTAAGEGFDFDQTLGDFSTIPDVNSLPAGDLRSFHDRRTFTGAYARDEWTPVNALTIGGGARYDNASETLHAQAQEQGPPLGPLEVADDHRVDHAWSGDVSGLVRLLRNPTPRLDAVNLYVSWKSSFKPAAPNLQEPEGAKILDPEHTRSLEVGLKTRALDRQVALDASWFDMKFRNMVVSTLDASLNPVLVNAGSERFKGIEVELTVHPNALPGSTLSLGYAHHDARFVQFTFVAPDGSLRDVSGKQIELVPREMLSARLDLQAASGIGAFAAVRGQGRRPLTRRNTFWADGYAEYDAGLSYAVSRYRVSVIGRNLGDDRHYVTESEIGDSQFYVAPQRRVSAEFGISY
jgi:outer membrane receptor protein involved in Fe transport